MIDSVLHMHGRGIYKLIIPLPVHLLLAGAHKVENLGTPVGLALAVCVGHLLSGHAVLSVSLFDGLYWDGRLPFPQALPTPKRSFQP